jgi:hypothetical protein
MNLSLMQLKNCNIDTKGWKLIVKNVKLFISLQILFLNKNKI